MTMERICKVVAVRYGVTLAQLRGEKRTHGIVWPRQVAMYMCRKHARRSYPAIGRHFGGRDHATAMHACRLVEHRMGQSQAVWDEVVGLHRLLDSLPSEGSPRSPLISDLADGGRRA